jgi:hypothetical protein
MLESATCSTNNSEQTSAPRNCQPVH